ncbi:MAG TPA: type II secretion system protein [Phycisphaerae bacterium]|nr:type II secretion system protein [Phycisphaerae bacterium]
MTRTASIFTASRHRRGFTLIELVVVIGIIAVLIGILIPVLSAARSRGRMTACSNNLRQLMLAMRSYLDANADLYPHATYMPSISPLPIEGATIYIADVLAPHMGAEKKAFACPADVGAVHREEEGATMPDFRTYYSTERSSYEYRTRLNGLTIKAVLDRRAEFSGRRSLENTYWVFRDFNNFHGDGGKPGARRYVYNDTHVGDFED